MRRKSRAARKLQRLQFENAAMRDELKQAWREGFLAGAHYLAEKIEEEVSERFADEMEDELLYGVRHAPPYAIGIDGVRLASDPGIEVS